MKINKIIKLDCSDDCTISLFKWMPIEDKFIIYKQLSDPIFIGKIIEFIEKPVEKNEQYLYWSKSSTLKGGQYKIYLYKYKKILIMPQISINYWKEEITIL